MITDYLFRFQVSGDALTIHKHDEPWQTLPLRGLSAEYIAWQVESRRALFQQWNGRATIPGFAPHLPSLATLNDEGSFPVNLATKGVGLLPREAHLATCTADLEATSNRVAGQDWSATLGERVAAVMRFYGRPEAIDRHCLAGLEIFETTTFRNLCRDPRAALLYAGPGPRYRSFQLNCAVEIVGPGDSRYRFIRAIRALFEYEGFHYQQPDYPYGYVFWVLETADKSLRVRGG